jgi:hypothetical protein
MSTKKRPALSPRRPPKAPARKGPKRITAPRRAPPPLFLPGQNYGFGAPLDNE